MIFYKCRTVGLTAFMFLSLCFFIMRSSCAERHFAKDREMWERELAVKRFQDQHARDSSDGTVQALYVVEESDKKMFRCIFPIQIKNTQIIRGQPLGDGSFGVVYIAKVAKNENKLAVKTSNKLQYTKLEYNALRQFDSRYFPKVYFFGIVKFGPNKVASFFGMELLKGSDMFQLLKHYDTPMTGEYLRYVAAQLLVAISLLHKKGFIHRDIKPENIMCCDNGTIKVIDFGGCLPAANDKTTFHEWFGTEEYMAPEQLDCVQKGTKNCAYTRLADWWGAGATIYYAAKFTDIQRGQPIQTSNQNLSDLIGKLCSNNPNARKFNYRSHPYFKGFNWKKTN